MGFVGVQGSKLIQIMQGGLLRDHCKNCSPLKWVGGRSTMKYQLKMKLLSLTIHQNLPSAFDILCEALNFEQGVGWGVQWGVFNLGKLKGVVFQRLRDVSIVKYIYNHHL